MEQDKNKTKQVCALDYIALANKLSYFYSSPKPTEYMQTNKGKKMFWFKVFKKEFLLVCWINGRILSWIANFSTGYCACGLKERSVKTLWREIYGMLRQYLLIQWSATNT